MRRLFLKNANLLDGLNPARPDQVVVLDGDRILASGRPDEVPGPGAEDHVLDLAGNTLMPGMVAGHFHSTFHNVGAEPGVPAQEHPPAFTAYRALANAQLALRCGFTSVVSAGCAYDIDASLEQAINTGLVEGPRVVPCSRDTLSSADNVIPWWHDIRSELGINRCDGPDELRKAVRQAINRGARLFKLTASGGHAVPQAKGTRMFSNAELRVAVEAAHDRGIRVRAHVAGKAAILDCIAAGIDILDHCDDMDEECIEAMLKADVFVLPSLYQTRKLVTGPPLFGCPKDQLEAEFDWMCAILPKAVTAGVKLCVGDDYGTAIIAHGEYAQELAIYVEHAGISPLEVIKWATHNGGAMTGIDDLGVVKEGMLADLLIVDGDPSQDISLLSDKERIVAVIARGKLVSGMSKPDFAIAGGHIAGEGGRSLRAAMAG